MEASGALLPLQAVAVEARCLSDDGVEHTHVELDTLVDVDNSSRRAIATDRPPPQNSHTTRSQPRLKHNLNEELFRTWVYPAPKMDDTWDTW